MPNRFAKIISLAIGFCAFGIVSQKMIALSIDFDTAGKKLKMSVLNTGVFPFKGKLRTFLISTT